MDAKDLFYSIILFDSTYCFQYNMKWKIQIYNLEVYRIQSMLYQLSYARF